MIRDSIEVEIEIWSSCYLRWLLIRLHLLVLLLVYHNGLLLVSILLLLGSKRVAHRHRLKCRLLRFLLLLSLRYLLLGGKWILTGKAKRISILNSWLIRYLWLLSVEAIQYIHLICARGSQGLIAASKNVIKIFLLVSLCSRGRLAKNIHKIIHSALVLLLGRCVIITEENIRSLWLRIIRCTWVEIVEVESCLWLFVVLTSDSTEITFTDKLHQINSSICFNLLTTLTF